MIVPVVALYAPLNAFFNIALAARVVPLRGGRGVSLGDDGSKEMITAIRVHGNNAEFVPLALVMLLVAELAGGASFVLHLAGGTLLLARISHALGLPRKAPNPLRSFGVAGTWGMIVAMGAYSLWLRTR